MTEEEVQTAIAYVARRMFHEDVDTDSPIAVARWMVQNPLPKKKEYEAQLVVWEEEERTAQIAALEEELERLKGGN